MDQPLKERLVGAVVLVAAGVVFIPMILSGANTDRHDDAERAPAAPPAAASTPGSFSSRIAPVERRARPGGGKSSASPPGTAPAGTGAVRSRAPAPSSNAPTPSATRRPEPPTGTTRSASAKAEPAESKPALEREPARTAGWVVQLGSFASERNANGLRERLRKKGYRAFVESVTRDGSRVTRVFVGPQPSREKSKAELDGLFKETGLKGIVVRYGS